MSFYRIVRPFLVVVILAACVLRSAPTSYGSPQVTTINLAGSGIGGSVVYVTSNYGEAWDVTQVIDGSPSTGWASFPSQNKEQEVIVDFPNGGTYPIDHIRINPSATAGSKSANNLKDFEIYVSTTTKEPAHFTRVARGTTPQTNAFYSVTFPAVSARYVKILALNNYGGDHIEIAELEIYGDGSRIPTNLAAAYNGGEIVSASSNYGGEWDVSLLIDGNKNTGWANQLGSRAVNQEIVLELAGGKTYLVNRIRINPHATSDFLEHSLKDYELYLSATSTAPESFVKVASGSIPLYGTKPFLTIDLDLPTPTRYVKIVGIDSHDRTFIELAEVEVYGPDTFSPLSAPDASLSGPLPVTVAEYKYPATIDPEIIPNDPLARKTELWGRVWRPINLSNTPAPLVLLLHGNHATCGKPGDLRRVDDQIWYTMLGTCDDEAIIKPIFPDFQPGYVVVPSHAGYDYLAQRLASWGYIVVSLNANRGINAGEGTESDPGLIWARGRLVLKHLQLWQHWNSKGNAPSSLGLGKNGLVGKVDLSKIGLMGHSRGGEGVRAAYHLYNTGDLAAQVQWKYRIPGLAIRAIFEIGPTDGGVFPLVDADGTAWNVILLLCDTDVYTLAGALPFSRMMNTQREQSAAQKSIYTVWGANHNYYNSEWQESESLGCYGKGHAPIFTPEAAGSQQQRQTALYSMLAFFRAHLGSRTGDWPVAPTFQLNFNPLASLPKELSPITPVERSFGVAATAADTLVLEDFRYPKGTNSSGNPNDASGITIDHAIVPLTLPKELEEDLPHNNQRGGVISWAKAASSTYFQANWAPAGQGRDISAYSTLDLRLARQFSALNPDETNFSVQLVYSDGSQSAAVPLRKYTALRGPVGSFSYMENGLSVCFVHPVMQTVRIPLRDFELNNRPLLPQVRGVRLTFDDTSSNPSSGAIYLGSLAFSRIPGAGAIGMAAPVEPPPLHPTPDIHCDYDPGMGPAPHPAAGAAPLAHGDGSGAGGAGLPTAPAPTISGSGTQITSAPIEVELFSPNGFPIRNSSPVLWIGNQAFDHGIHKDGRTLRFKIAADQFGALAEKADVALSYGRSKLRAQWYFGPLNKSRPRMREDLRGTRQHILESFIKLRNKVTRQRGLLTEIITKITETQDQLPQRDQAQQLHDGTTYFAAEKAILAQLQHLIQLADPELPAATLNGVAKRMLYIDRGMVRQAIDDTPAESSLRSDKELEQGDGAAAAGRYDQAIEHYQNVWAYTRPQH